MTVGDLINLLRFTNSAIEVKIRIGDSDYPIRAELEGRFKEMQTFQLFAELPEGCVMLTPGVFERSEVDLLKNK